MTCATCGGSDPDGGSVVVAGPDENGQYDADDCPDHRVDTTPPHLRPGQTCTACNGHGWYYGGDWAHAYPRRRCDVCEGSGQMARRPDGSWGPA